MTREELKAAMAGRSMEEILGPSEEAPPEPKNWVPRPGDNYWYFTARYNLRETIWVDESSDEERFYAGNCFPSYEAAKRGHAEMAERWRAFYSKMREEQDNE